jgi:hypothetical protein
MTEYRKQTDTEHTEKLTSRMVTAEWVRKIAYAGDSLPLEVWTHFVGNGAAITIKVKNQKGKTVETLKGQVFGNRFAGRIVIPEKDVEALVFTAKLSKHGLQADSNTCRILPPVKITNQKWDRQEARRGDVVKLTADTHNIADGEQLMLMIYEYDQDGAHDFIAKFPCRVRANKIDADWEYEYHEDTDEIPTDAEMQKGGRRYNPPEYFWVADLHGRRFGEKQESGLLKFKDWLEVLVTGADGEPLSNCDVTVKFADGTDKTVTTNGEGLARYQDLVPGPVEVEFEEPEPSDSDSGADDE